MREQRRGEHGCSEPVSTATWQFEKQRWLFKVARRGLFCVLCGSTRFFTGYPRVVDAIVDATGQFSQSRTSVRVTSLHIQLCDSPNLTRNAIPKRETS